MSLIAASSTARVPVNPPIASVPTIREDDTTTEVFQQPPDEVPLPTG